MQRPEFDLRLGHRMVRILPHSRLTVRLQLQLGRRSRDLILDRFRRDLLIAFGLLQHQAQVIVGGKLPGAAQRGRNHPSTILPEGRHETSTGLVGVTRLQTVNGHSVVIILLPLQDLNRGRNRVL